MASGQWAVGSGQTVGGSPIHRLAISPTRRYGSLVLGAVPKSAAAHGSGVGAAGGRAWPSEFSGGLLTVRLYLPQVHRQVPDQRTVVANALPSHGFGSIGEGRDSRHLLCPDQNTERSTDTQAMVLGGVPSEFLVQQDHVGVQRQRRKYRVLLAGIKIPRAASWPDGVGCTTTQSSEARDGTAMSPPAAHSWTTLGGT